MKTKFTPKKNVRITLPAWLVCLCLFFNTSVQAQNCTVNAGVAQSICTSSTSLTGNANGNYSASPEWTFVSGPVTPTIVSPASLNSQVTGMTASGVYTFKLSLACQSGDTVSQNVNVTANAMPTFTAGTPFAFCGTSGVQTMNATLPAGWTGTWSVGDATNPGSDQTFRFTFSDIHSPTSTVTYSNPGCPLNSYTFKWEVTSPNGLCQYTQSVHGIWNPDPATLQWNTPPVTVCMGAPILFFKNGGCGFWGGYNPDYVFTTTVTSAPAGFTGTVTLSTTVGGDIGVNGLTMAGHYTFNASLASPCGNTTVGPFDITVLPPPPTVTGSTSVAYCIKAIPSTVSFPFTLADSTTVLTLVSSAVPTGADPINVTQSGTGYNRTFSVTPNTGWAPSDYYLNFKAVSAQDTGGYCPKMFTALIVVYDSLPISMSVADMNVCIPTGNTTVDAMVTLPGYAPYLTADYGPRYRLTKLSGPVAGPGTLVGAYYATTAVLGGLTAGQYTYKIQPLSNSPFADEVACSPGPDADTFSINVYNATGANAGTDQNVACIQNYSLVGNVIPSPSYGTWTQISGPTVLQFANAHNPSTTVGTTATALSGTYMFSWTTSDSNNSCPIYADTVIVVASTGCSNPLPLQMTAFTVRKVNDKAQLNWATATEENIRSFTAEWSITGGRNNDWQAIGTLPAKGKGATGASYSLTHSPAPGRVNYYRIRITEENSVYEYSPVATLVLDGSETIPQVYPIPVTDILQVYHLDAGSKLSLYSLEGLLLWKGVSDNGKAAIDMGAWQPGMYLLDIRSQSGSRKMNYKIIKK
ncbi:T9SS type A sorting domain-containing protein [Taibaiella koreensis]|uniref:T9SS type A sorting domain-containing protein n=1 Tax=Taibaiella koreensis TaxID=1268548 RepID=UPI000E599F00|nr:T9SS type A sorting domain-containing protein [Taibaiella koreensis]